MLREKRTAVVQMRDASLAIVSDRKLQPGDKIPTETELAELYGSSRPTIREALKLLEQSGSILVKHGRGRYLTAAGTLQVDRPITEFESLTDMSGHLGYVLENRVISVSEERPSPDVAKALSLPEADAVIRLERVRLHEGVTLVYCLEFIRQSALSQHFSDVDWCGSLLDTLERYSDRPIMSSAKVSSVRLPDEVIHRNKLEGFGPALLIEETAFTLSGAPVLFAKNYHSGSHFAFSFLRK